MNVMEWKRTKLKNKIDELPLDCWGEILTFMSTRDDFMNFMLTVNGLYEYLKTICPSFTRNIEFRFHSVPWDAQNQVTYLKFESDADSEYWDSSSCPILRTAKCSSHSILFDRLGGKFPNLKRLKLNWYHSGKSLDFVEQSKENYDIVISSGEINGRNFLNGLKRLYIVYPSDVKIDEKMNNLVDLYVNNGMHLWDSKEAETKLELSRDCLPSLSKMEVVGFKIFGMKQNTCIQSNLTTLELGKDSEISDDNFIFDGFSNLETFRINDGMSNKMKLVNFPKLTTFIHSPDGDTYWDYIEEIRENRRSCDIHFFGKLPKIERIEFIECFFFDDEDELLFLPFSRIKLFVSNYPFLKKLNMRSPQHIILSGCLMLSDVIIRSSNCDIQDINSMKNLERFDCVTSHGTTFGEHNEVSNFRSLKYFRSSSKLNSTSISFTNNPSLETLIFDGIEKVSGCHSLKTLEIEVENYNLSSLDLGILKSVVINRIENQEDTETTQTKFLEYMKRLLSFTKQPKTLINNFKVHFGKKSFSESGVFHFDESVDLRSIQNLTVFFNGSLSISGILESQSFSFLSKIELHHCSDVFIKNLKSIREIILDFGDNDINLGHRNTVVHNIVIEGCPELQLMSIKDFSYEDGIVNSIENLILSNLPKLKTMKIGTGFSGIGNLKIRNSPIEVLDVVILEKCHGPTSRSTLESSTTASVFNITCENFPALMRLVLRTSYGGRFKVSHVEFPNDYFFEIFENGRHDVLRIGDLENISNLESIILTDIGCQREMFARDILSGFDVKKKILFFYELNFENSGSSNTGWMFKKSGQSKYESIEGYRTYLNILFEEWMEKKKDFEEGVEN